MAKRTKATRIPAAERDEGAGIEAQTEQADAPADQDPNVVEEGEAQQPAVEKKPEPIGFGAPPGGSHSGIESLIQKGEETVLVLFPEECRITEGGKQIVCTQGVHKVPKRLANHWYFKAAGARPV